TVSLNRERHQSLAAADGHLTVLYSVFYDVVGFGRRSSGQRFPCYDFGFFVALGFPFSMVWYLLWTRGLRGLLVIGIFLGLYLTPWLCAIGVWAVTTGLDR